MCVVGARPNFVKVAPLVHALGEHADVDVRICNTGQHYDRALAGSFIERLGMREPDANLGVGSGSHAEQTARVMLGFEPWLQASGCDAVVVVGDVNSTLACALVAAKLQLPVAHVEAGLRSRDWAMPEEVNRVVTDSVSDDLLAPSADAVENLLAEGHPQERIHLVGNVMIDTLLTNLDRATAGDVLDRLAVTAGSYGLVTLHRPANVDDVEMLASLLKALG